MKELIQDFFNQISQQRTGEDFTPGAMGWLWAACTGSYFLAAPLGCYLGSEATTRLGRKKG